MKTFSRKFGFAAGVAAVAFALVSCSSSDPLESGLEAAVEQAFKEGIEQSGQQGGDPDVSADFDFDDEGGLTIKTEDGEMSFGTSSELSEGYPIAGAPLPEGVIASSMKFTEAGVDNFMVGVAAPGSIKDVGDDVAARLGGAGLTQISDADLETMRSFIYEGTGDVASVSATLIEDPNENLVTVSYIVVMAN